MTSQSNLELPLTFRAEVVTPLLHYLAAGDSCAVVGIGSVGKSNLLRFLLREAVQRHYLNEAWASYLFIYVDINKILKANRWGLFELMLHQLLLALTTQGTEPAMLEQIDKLHRRATDPKRRYLALRYLDRAVRIACDELGLRLVFLFDEFDDLARVMSPQGFAALRALRDDYKYRLMYLVATRLEIKRLREETQPVEAFEELIASHTFWLGPYTETDARLMIERLERRHHTPLPETLVDKILTATGGHPGLLREAYDVARASPDNFEDLVTQHPPILDECRRIWLSLPSAEQEALISLAGQLPSSAAPAEVLDRLRRKGLVGGAWSAENKIFSSLLSTYLHQQTPQVGAKIYIDPEQRLVSVNGHEIRDLTPLEFELIAFLEKNRGRSVSRDEIAQHLYPEDMVFEGEGVSDTRLHSLVKRLRRRIEPTPQEPRYILTVRGHGFRLADED